MKNIVIVGGGVAGLSALNRLADLGVSATLIEGGGYPAHKICGEFFSAESMPLLEKWDLPPLATIDSISLATRRSSLTIPLSPPARGEARFDFDLRLLKRAEAKGARILTHTKVLSIEKGKLTLDNNETILYTDLIMSTGRLFGSSEPRYIGIKGHLTGIELNQQLEMYPFPGGYGGLSPIGKGQVNFACLIRGLATFSDPIKSLFKLAPHLAKRLEAGSLSFSDWMVGKVPSFGIKQVPSWPNTYFIGDAAGTIPPASGLGLSLAITSGYIAADYALKGDFLGFKKEWEKRYARVFAYGHLLHHTLMTPLLYHSAIKLGGLFPSLAPRLFQLTRL